MSLNKAFYSSELFHVAFSFFLLGYLVSFRRFFKGFFAGSIFLAGNSTYKAEV